MINTNEKLLDQLDSDQYFLISKIVKYGKKSCPKNEVLKSATKWGIKKVQRVKKELIALNLLVSNKRWKYVDGKRMRDSNEYVVTTPFISKYRGKESTQLCQIGIVQLGTDENDLVQFGTDEFELDELELDENGTGNKVLRIIIIEDNKVLNKVNIEKEEKYKKEISALKDKIKKLESKEEKPKEDSKVNFIKEIREILAFFVLTTGNPLRINEEDNLLARSDKYKTIMPRLKNGATVDECKAVISLKTKEWKNDKDMSKHLCIPTLFRASKFEKYLDELGTVLPSNKKFPYPLPDFLDKEDRQSYFYVRYNSYKPYLDIQKVNTIYKKRALYEKDAEGLCFELELKKPKLAELEIKYVRI